MRKAEVEIVEYSSEHQPAFERLNREWIEKYFTMEEPDFQMLSDPDEHILKPGGSIFLASYRNEMVGTVALKRHSAKVYELTKMAVDGKHQGKKIGRTLAQAAIARAKDSGAEKIILYSNTMLVPAVALYNGLGFREIRGDDDGLYKRVDIKMELILT